MPLSIHAASGDPLAATVDVLALVVTEGGLEKQKPLADLDRTLGGALTDHAKSSEFTGKPEQVLELVTLGRGKAKRVLLVGVGDKRQLDEARLLAASATASRTAGGFNAKTLALSAPDGSDLRVMAQGIALGAYRFTRYLTGDRKPKAELRDVQLFKGGKSSGADKAAIELGMKLAEAVAIARDAVNEPPNELNPAALADLARKVAKKHKLQITVLDKKGIGQAGMKLLYAVGQGSVNEPRFIHMIYKPKKAKKKKAKK